MKKIFIACLVTVVFSACNNDSKTDSTEDTVSTMSPSDNTGSSMNGQGMVDSMGVQDSGMMDSTGSNGRMMSDSTPQ
ncbi:MAG: hypothetical protein ABWZ25_16890 [Chitinophagaceae bacterium]